MSAPPPPTWPDALLRAANAERARLDISPLLADARLAAAAALQGAHLAGAAAPDLCGSAGVYEGWRERMAAAEWPAMWPCGMGVISAATPQGAVTNWMASWADRAALLNPAFDAAGFANVTARDGTHIWVAAWGGMAGDD
jgi:hypothetical protein